MVRPDVDLPSTSRSTDTGRKAAVQVGVARECRLRQQLLTQMIASSTSTLICQHYGIPQSFPAPRVAGLAGGWQLQGSTWIPLPTK